VYQVRLGDRSMQAGFSTDLGLKGRGRPAALLQSAKPLGWSYLEWTRFATRKLGGQFHVLYSGGWRTVPAPIDHLAHVFRRTFNHQLDTLVR
jgi:hypothetical protein